MIKKVIFCLVTLLSIVGCGKGEKKDQGKFLRVVKHTALATIDQSMSTDAVSFEVINTTKEGFYDVEADGTQIPALAKSYDLSEDGLTYTFHLRDGIKWSNGDPITAKDFVFAWQREVDPETAAPYYFLFATAGVKNSTKVSSGELPKEELGIKAIDDKTVEVTLERPVPFFLSLTAFPPFFPLNEKFLKEQGENYGMGPENVLASGPFKLTEWKKGYGFTVSKNMDYYGADNIKIDGIQYRVIKDSQTAALKFEAGEVDVVTLSSELVDKYVDKDEFQGSLTGFMWYLSYNNQSGILKNANIRKALSMGVDKDYIVDSILKDGSKVANFLVPEGIIKSPEGKDFRSVSPEYLVYNKEEALKYWNKGLEELGVKEATLELLFDDFESNKRTAEFIQNNLEETFNGLKVTLKAQPKKNRLKLMRSGNYEFAIAGWGPSYADPQTYLEIFESKSGFNYAKHQSDLYDKYIYNISKGDSVGDPVARWSSLLGAEKTLLGDEAGIGPLFQKGSAFLIRKGVSGIDHHVAGTPYTYKNVTIDRSEEK